MAEENDSIHGGEEQSEGTQQATAGGQSLLSEQAGGQSGQVQQKAAQAVPEKYELKSPDGLTWNDGQMGQFQEQAKGMGLNQEQAQKLLEMAHTNHKATMDAHQSQVDKWADEIKMDKEMGGAAFDATVAHAKAGLKAFDGDNKVLNLLNESGYANHPDIIRVLSKLGKAMADDGFVAGKGSGESDSLADRMYKNMKV